MVHSYPGECCQGQRHSDHQLAQTIVHPVYLTLYGFRATPASIAMGNRQASDTQGELWTARVDDRYVVGPGSIHADTNGPYEVINDASIVEAPQWLIDWCVQQTEDKPTK